MTKIEADNVPKFPFDKEGFVYSSSERRSVNRYRKLYKLADEDRKLLDYIGVSVKDIDNSSSVYSFAGSDWKITIT